ncbi:MAG: winged helix-turn-helix domain-containing protein [Acidobacteriia bacterium]|nr:winged helix-turn-helix domain-containing protein [Terriglobia bacterium]
MAINHQVGETAGAIWNLLERNGPQTLAQLKKKLDGNGELMNFAVGWLAREEKVEIIEDRKTFQIRLRS